jgi:hypothetical protein
MNIGPFNQADWDEDINNQKGGGGEGGGVHEPTGNDNPLAEESAGARIGQA